MKKLALGVSMVVVCLLGAFAQDNAPHVVNGATSKFIKLQVAPQCMEASAQEGDPMKGAAVLLIKMQSGCVVPWHWHSANERLYMVSGRGKIEMKDHGAEVVAPSDYVFLAAKGIHQFTCTTTCTFFDVTDAAFDIHYVKADGSEIPPEEALKAGAKKAPAKKK